jgi:hypothetical protein
MTRILYDEGVARAYKGFWNFGSDTHSHFVGGIWILLFPGKSCAEKIRNAFFLSALVDCG